MDFKTADDLKNYMTKDKYGSKLKFAVKLFLTLNFTSHNQDMINQTGACWLSDGVRFMANSQIFADFINLKSNSVNANFRMHFFKIHNSSHFDALKEFPWIKDSKNYKIRSNTNYAFSVTSTLNYINTIPCDNILTQQICNVFQPMEIKIPLQLYSFVKDNKEMHLKIELIFTKLQKPQIWKVNFFLEALNEWKQITNKLEVDISKIQNFALNEINTQISSNLAHLLNQISNSSYSDSNVSLDTYLNFVSRFGFLQNCKDTLLFLSSMNHFDLDENGAISPSFKNWFKPFFNEAMAISFLTDKPNNSWVLRPSSAFGKFTLHSKRKQGNIATHISVDPLSSEKMFSVEVENSKFLNASSLRYLLFDVLKLPVIDEIKENNEIKPSLYVNATEFITNDQICEKQNHLFFPISIF